MTRRGVSSIVGSLTAAAAVAAASEEAIEFRLAKALALGEDCREELAKVLEGGASISEEAGC